MSNSRAKVHGLAVLVGSMLMASHADANPIQVENAKPGTSSWQLANPAPSREIEGYASLTSVNRGGTISLFVSTSDPSYSIEVFRMGWYQGLGARQVMGPVTRAGMIQSMPDADAVTGLIECNWLDPYQLTIPLNASDPTDWASGVYLAKLTGTASQKQSYIVFVVRDDARPSDFLFQSSVTTAAAYNNWGGKSLYPYSSCGSVAATKVSFNRPYRRLSSCDSLGSWDPGPDPDPWVGAGEFFQALGGYAPAWECNMVRFLEREGADVTYCTDVDTHEQSSLLLPHKGFLSVGHDEYWSWEMRDHVEAGRDNCVNLGFFCANTCYWQIRFESDSNGAPNRTVVCYKDAYMDDPLWQTPDHSRVTSLWRDPFAANRSEGALLGVQFGAYGFPADDLVIYDASHWICHGTGLQNNDVLPGLVGNEVDALYTGPEAPSNIAIIARSPFLDTGVTSDFVVHTATSGAYVIATGTFQWSWGLDDYGADASLGPVVRPSFISEAAQQMTRNILSQFIGADLAITQTASPDPVLTGSAITYTITVTNLGPEPVAAATVADNLPGSVTYLSCSATNGGVCDGLGNDRLVTFPYLAVGESANITIQAIVSCSLGDGTPISNTATVTSTSCERERTNNSATATVTVVNTEITVTLNRYVLWPPTHRLSPITATVTVTDFCGQNPTFVLTSVSSSEPDNDRGDGDTVGDIQGVDVGTSDTEFYLRSERSGRGTGREYTIVYTASDESGNNATATVCVQVPHDQSGRAVCANGFAANGRGIGTTGPSYFLVVPSRAATRSTPAIDATMFNPSRTFVGNHLATITALSSRFWDATGDALPDLVLEYPTYQSLALASVSGEDPLGLRYEDQERHGFLVPDIFSLGRPIVLVFPDVPAGKLARASEQQQGPNPAGLLVPTTTGIRGIQPNPFNPSARVSFDLASDGWSRIEVYDLRGRLVRRLVNGNLPAGRHEVTWDGRDQSGRTAPTGVYFFRLATPDVEETRKAVLMK